MYPYTPPGAITPITAGTNNAPSCYDSSPNFLEDPKVVTCSNFDAVYNNLGFDPDLGLQALMTQINSQAVADQSQRHFPAKRVSLLSTLLLQDLLPLVLG
jgi:hypothetical protein